MRKKDTLPFVTKWANIKHIILSTKSHKKVTNVGYHLYVKYKKSQTYNSREQNGGCHVMKGGG